MKKRVLATLLCMVMAFATLAGCGNPDAETNNGTDAPNAGQSTDGDGSEDEAVVSTTTGGELKSIEAFMYASLDPHKDYYSWHSQRYGLTESLFRLNDDIQVEPWLAESLTIEDNVATLVLKDGVCFSNGNPLTAEMVKRNMERLSEMNNRFLYLQDFELEATDDKTLVITMSQILPTLENELANPEFCFIDLDGTTDIDNNPISTGPFAVNTFIPEGDLTLVRNENYWDGDVNLDGVTFYAMSDPQSKLMAMQNGEVDVYDGLSATDIEIFAADPDQYKLHSVPTEARTFMYLNPQRIDEPVREAINLVVDREAIAAFMGGVMTPSYSVFNDNAIYGTAKMPSTDLAAAAAVMEAGGYELNSSGVYEKDGQTVPVIGLYCYAARSIDQIAVLVQEQLTNFGIPSEIRLKEDPDGSYVSDRDFDIGFYRMTTDKTGDSMTFIEGVIMSGSYQDIVGYGNAATDAEIEQLRYTVDPADRAEIANKIMQDYYSSNVFCPLVSYNKNVVMRAGVTHFSETNPYEFYGPTAQTTAANK